MEARGGERELRETVHTGAGNELRQLRTANEIHATFTIPYILDKHCRPERALKRNPAFKNNNYQQLQVKLTCMIE